MSVLDGAMRMAAVCGLSTVREAVLNYDRHAMSFLPYPDIPGKLTQLYNELDEWERSGKSPEIPQEIVDEVNREMDEYFSRMEQRQEALCESEE